MGSITKQVKDSAIAGDFLARTQWLQDEITEFQDALKLYGHAIRVGGLRGSEIQRASAYDEALDVFGLLVIWNDKRVDNWFAWKMSDLILSRGMEEPELDFFLRAIDDETLDSKYFQAWQDKNVSRGRTPVSSQMFSVLRTYLDTRFKLRRKFADMDIRINTVNLDNVDEILRHLFGTDGRGRGSNE